MINYFESAAISRRVREYPRLMIQLRNKSGIKHKLTEYLTSEEHIEFTYLPNEHYENAKKYWQFLLDINQQQGESKPFYESFIPVLSKPLRGNPKYAIIHYDIIFKLILQFYSLNHLVDFISKLVGSFSPYNFPALFYSFAFYLNKSSDYSRALSVIRSITNYPTSFPESLFSFLFLYLSSSFYFISSFFFSCGNNHMDNFASTSIMVAHSNNSSFTNIIIPLLLLQQWEEYETEID